MLLVLQLKSKNCPLLNKFDVLPAVVIILEYGFSILYLLIVGLCMGNNNC